MLITKKHQTDVWCFFMKVEQEIKKIILTFEIPIKDAFNNSYQILLEYHNTLKIIFDVYVIGLLGNKGSVKDVTY